jgi:hypothetical protein
MCEYVRWLRHSGIYGCSGGGIRIVLLAEVVAMLDFVMIVLGVAFFAASVAYVLACERM